MLPIELTARAIRFSPDDLVHIAAGHRGVPLPEEVARKLAMIVLAAAADMRISVVRESTAVEDAGEAAALTPARQVAPELTPPRTATIRSIAHERASRDHKRFLTLQAQLARRGFALDPLTPETYLLQFRGLTGVLHDLDAAQRFLDELGGADA